MALAILAQGLAGLWPLVEGPREVWLHHPWTMNWLHPYIRALDCVITLPVGLGLAIKSRLRR